MRLFAVAVGDMNKCRTVGDGANVELGQAGFFFEFAQSGDATCFMAFDMAARSRSFQGFVRDEQGVFGIG